MILKELHKYYERLLEDSDYEVADKNWSIEKVVGEFYLDREGKVVSAIPFVTESDTGTKKFKSLRVPEHFTRSGSGLQPFFLCDNPAYLLGYDQKRGKQKLESSKFFHQEVLSSCKDEGARAILCFFERADRDEILSEQEKLDIQTGAGFWTFHLSGDHEPIHKRPAVAQAWKSYCNKDDDDAVVGQCSVTGRQGVLERLFPQITGVPGAQSAGASLVSFNLQSFESYGKTQAYNASISKEAAFNAGSALRQLYSDPLQHVRFGDMTIVFWSDEPAPSENAVVQGFLDSDTIKRAQNKQLVEQLDKAFETMREGKPVEDCDPNVRFYILGISPNAARLSVRFFETDTFGRLTQNYGAYLRDIEMVGVKACSLKSLLLQTAPLGKYEAIPSTLINACMSSMLTGRRFPQALLYVLLSRMRADHAQKNAWDMGRRAALLKACFVRKSRFERKGNCTIEQKNFEEERGLTVALNRERTNRGYILGRLFAVVERAQSAALGGNVNATIRDRFVGAASTTPARVFPHLLHNMQNHLAKLRKSKPGLAINLEKELNIITDLIDGDELFPKAFDANNQGEFFIGYYQEREYLWLPSKKENELSNPDEQQDEE